jgi:hypothetical protein
MTHYLPFALACVFYPSFTGADDPGLQATVSFVQNLQTKNGGFLAQAGTDTKGVPSLRATSSGARTLHYLKGELLNPEGCIQFVASCHDAQSGGFADTPNGKPDVVTTAIGLMAVHELKMPVDKYGPGAIKFLSEKARTFEEIRMAAAGLESIQAKSPKNQAWLDEVLKQSNPDGTFGMGAGRARATAGAIVTILRLGGTPKDPALILKVLKEDQRFNGGYGKEDNEIASDLESTYRVMRCFMMLKAQPDRVEGLRTFIAKCRNEDGGYGVGPGQPSSLSGTYYAAIIKHWQEQFGK